MIYLYCLVIAAVSLAGGCLPLSTGVSHLKMQVYLSLSAGAMLGAACFHMLPEAAELARHTFGWWIALGVIGLYVIERFLSPHSNSSTEADDDADDAAPAAHDHAGHAHGAHPELHSAAPRVAGWSAVTGLSIHTLLGGVALGSAVFGPASPPNLGFAVFLATALHKPADSLTISTLLMKAHIGRRRTLLVQEFFSRLIPLGAALFYVGKSFLAGQLNNVFTGSALAFSSGTFLCIALADLLPEVQFHSHDRLKLFLAFIFGAALMGATSLFEP